MEGHLYQRGKSKAWYLRYDEPASDGEKRKQANVRIGTMSKSAAEAKKRDLLRELDDGTWTGSRKTYTVEQFFTKWLESRSPTLASKTHERYASVVRLHVVPEIGKLHLSKVTPEHIERIQKVARAKGLSEQSLLHIHRVLHTAFADAYRGAKKYGIAENVVKRVKAPRPRKRELRSMKPDDIRLLIQVAQGTRLEVPVAVAAVTGLRRSELLALRWANVDLDKGSVFVCEALEHTRQAERIRFKGPKSPSSRRLIPLANDCIALLQAHKVEQDRVRKESRAFYTDHDLVFPNPDGSPWPPDTFSVQFAKLAKLVGLQGFRFHDVRHAFATLTLADGRSAKEVQALMGHSSMVTTLDIYAHQVEGMGREAVNSLARSLLSAAG